MDHYFSNIELLKNLPTYVFRQSDPKVANLKYGRLGRRFEQVGCGMAATYNVMKKLGREQPLPDIIRDAERLHMPWLFGLFGTKPKSLGRYFKSKSVPFAQATDCQSFKDRLSSARAAIICTWNDKRLDGIHFYAVFNEGGRLRALNYYDEDEATLFSADELRSDRFIVGYLFG